MELEEFNKKLWFIYPKDLCHGKKGTKFNAEKAARKLKPNQYEAILASVEALIRYDRKDMKPDRWPFVSSFLNQGYYDRDIGSVADLKEKQQLKTCTIENCKNDVHGSMYKYCSDHIPNAHSDLLAKAWTRQGIDYKSPTFVDDCRKQCRNYMNVIMGKVE